ncbi:gp57 [Bacillus phage G]|uniref:Gp57 n=1 Tax=Bacillus phage G TaxID=2884420 RepID=G3MBC7_9CAUD|nr:gp57 [Bacillus phage G]AEO93328.1 gp57 [Bacillus phage G]
MKKRLLKKISAPSLERILPGYPNDFIHSEKGLEIVNVDDIIGMSFSRADEYDDNFQPIGEPDDRWKSLHDRALQEGNLDFAGPIHLVQQSGDNKYYVYDDGNHRLSVAKFLNIPTLQAVVTVLIPKNDEIEAEIEGIMKEIKKQESILNQLTKEQNNLWNDDLSLDEINLKVDEIEEKKKPLYETIDNLWLKLTNYQNNLIN